MTRGRCQAFQPSSPKGIQLSFCDVELRRRVFLHEYVSEPSMMGERPAGR